jgi:hypothetical protein
MTVYYTEYIAYQIYSNTTKWYIWSPDLHDVREKIAKDN